MAARGTNAKLEVTKKIQEAFGENFVGEIDKKLYVWANDDGEKVQIAIALTCPKTFVGEVRPAESAGGWDFDAPPQTVTSEPETASFSDEEKNNIASLMERLGL